MKTKHLLCFVLLSALASCNDKLIVDNENENGNGESLSPITRAAGDAQFDVLGYGYDITGDYLNPTSVRFPVLDVKRYSQEKPGRLDAGTPVNGGDRMYFGATAEDYIEEITKDFNESASVSVNKENAFSGSISGNQFLKSKESYSSKYSFASYDAIRSHKYLKINDEVESLSNYLTPEFLEDVDRLSPARLVERYGTHVLTDVTIGGRYRLLFRSVIEKTTNSSEKKEILKAGFGATIKKVGIQLNAGVSIDTQTEKAKENQHKELFVMFYGGTGTCMQYDLENGMPTTLDINGWESNVSLNNANLTDINWKETYPLYYFIKDPQKRQQVKNAIENYIKDHSLDMVKVEPFYCYYSAKYVNHSYFTEWQGYHFNTDDYMGITCYLPSKYEPGAVPLYEYYSAKYVNHSYFTEYKGKHFNTDDYQGIVGYIFKDKKEGTVPLYAYYSAKYVNHSYFAEDKGRQFNTDERIGILGYVYPAD